MRGKIAMVSIVLIVLIGLFLSFIVFPARELAYVDSAIGSLRSLNDCAQRFAAAHPQQGFAKTLQDMPTDSLTDGKFVGGVRNHYQYTYLPRISAKGSVDGYQIHADPVADNKGWHFYTDETGVIRAKEGAPANEASPGL